MEFERPLAIAIVEVKVPIIALIVELIIVRRPESLWPGAREAKLSRLSK